MKIENIVNIDIQCQTLKFTEFSYPISSAKNGLGEKENSFKTPRGKFKIYKKIGENAIKNTIFIGRKATNIWDKKLTNKDLILSRILCSKAWKNQTKILKIDISIFTVQTMKNILANLILWDVFV